MTGTLCDKCGQELPELNDDEWLADVLLAAGDAAAGHDVTPWRLRTEGMRTYGLAIAHKAREELAPKVTRTVRPPVVIGDDATEKKRVPKVGDSVEVKWRSEWRAGHVGEVRVWAFDVDVGDRCYAGYRFDAEGETWRFCATVKRIPTLTEAMGGDRPVGVYPDGVVFPGGVYQKPGAALERGGKA